MKKYLTYRNAAIVEWLGLAMLVATLFVPAHGLADILLSFFGGFLFIIGIVAYWHQQGYEKGFTEGHEDARRSIREETSRLVKPEETPLWEALSQSRDAEDAEGVIWGTDYWEDILSEPSEEQARRLAKASGSNVYSRQPHCEWVKADAA